MEREVTYEENQKFYKEAANELLYFSKIRSDYKTGKIKIGVDLSLGRAFLTEIQDFITVILSSLFTIAFIASFFVGILNVGFILGIIYGLLFCSIFMSYIGVCSINTPSKTYIFYACIIASIASIILYNNWVIDTEILVILLFAFISFCIPYLFYKYVGIKIRKIMFRDYETFAFLLQSDVITIYE